MCVWKCEGNWEIENWKWNELKLICLVINKYNIGSNKRKKEININIINKKIKKKKKKLLDVNWKRRRFLTDKGGCLVKVRKWNLFFLFWYFFFLVKTIFSFLILTYLGVFKQLKCIKEIVESNRKDKTL